MTTQGNIETVRDFIESFWNRRDPDAIDRYLTDDHVDHAYSPKTVEGLRAAGNALVTAFPDQCSTIETMIAEGDRVVARLTLRGTHRGPFRGTGATGNSVEVTVYREYRLIDGKIAEHQGLLDTATLLRQIGTSPTPENACERRDKA